MTRCVIAILLSLAAMSAGVRAQVTSAPAATLHRIRIALAGDSTVTDNAGWGKGFANSFTDEVEVINFSRGGRSSGSFVKEGLWTKVLDLKPDYVLVQFGHNDQPGHGADRETEPRKGYRTNMQRYVDEAKAAGIKVVLVTSLSRRQWGDDGKIHSTLEPYVEVVKEIAANAHVPVIDLHARSIALYEKMGREGVLAISPTKAPTKAPSTTPSSAAASTPAAPTYDGTHLNSRGSALIGPIVARELAVVVPEFAAFLKPSVHADAAAGREITVGGAGADFQTIQQAIDSIREEAAERTIIRIRPGTYEGPILIPASKPRITFAGEDAERTIITYAKNVYDPIPPGIDKFNPAVNVRSDDFRAENITIQNTSGDHGQALALRLDGDRAVLRNCRLVGWQDTLMVNNGRDYFKDCSIEGRVDFIYGSATAVFDHCEIHSKNGGYVTAASTPADHPFGLVFLDCHLSGDATPWNPATTNPAATQRSTKQPNKLAYLGRPWRPNAAVAFLNCEMDDHIRPEGWHNWGKPDNEKTARYVEFHNTGPGAERARRVSWSKELTEAEAKTRYTIPNILGGSDHWNPLAE